MTQVSAEIVSVNRHHPSSRATTAAGESRREQQGESPVVVVHYVGAFVRKAPPVPERVAPQRAHDHVVVAAVGEVVEDSNADATLV